MSWWHGGRVFVGQPRNTFWDKITGRDFEEEIRAWREEKKKEADAIKSKAKATVDKKHSVSDMYEFIKQL